MKSIELKQEIHGYIEQVDDSILQAIKTLVKPSIDQMKLSQTQLEILEERKKHHLAGGSQSHTWEQTQEMIKAGKNELLHRHQGGGISRLVSCLSLL
jgi:hypothetical protein